MEARLARRKNRALDRQAFGLDKGGSRPESLAEETVDQLARAMSEATKQADAAGPEDKTMIKRLLEKVDSATLLALAAAGVLSGGLIQEIISKLAR